MHARPNRKKPALCWVCGAVLAAATLTAVLISERRSEARNEPQGPAPARYAELVWTNVNELHPPSSPTHDFYVPVIAIQGDVHLPAGHAR